MSIHVIGFFYFLPEIPHYKFVGFFKKKNDVLVSDLLRVLPCVC